MSPTNPTISTTYPPPPPPSTPSTLPASSSDRRYGPLGTPIPTHHTPLPSNTVSLHGCTVSLVPLSLSHANELYDQLGGLEHAGLWDYMLSGPYRTRESWQESVGRWVHGGNGGGAAGVGAEGTGRVAVYWAVLLRDTQSERGQERVFSVEESGATPATAAGKDADKATDNDKTTKRRAAGILSLYRIDTANRVIEVGNVIFGPLLHRTIASTEVFYLLGRYVFEELGYRRFEWKCNSLNEPSKRAAKRLGFRFEGVFRKHMIVKGLSRDTWWASIVDGEWFGEAEGGKGEDEEGGDETLFRDGERRGGVKETFERWLDKENFDERGRQRRRLEDVREEVVGGKDGGEDDLRMDVGMERD